MKLYLDTSAAILSLNSGSTSGISNLKVKRGDYVPLEIIGDIPIGATGVFAAKATIGGTLILFTSSWTAPSTDGGGYILGVSLNTTELNALFTTGVTSVTLFAEITWSAASGQFRTTQTFNLLVEADVWTGGEMVPTSTNLLLPMVTIVSAAPAHENDFTMFTGNVAPTVGSYEFQDDRFVYKIKGGQSLWSRIQLSGWNT